MLVILAACGDSGAGPIETSPDVDVVETTASPDADDSSDTTPDTEPDIDPDTEVDPAFDPSAVLEVSITLPPADWDALRMTMRDPLMFVGADCLDQPLPSPFSWYSASVTIGGETLADVGIRKKGNITAYETERPPLRLDFDRNVPGRELLGHDDMVLNRAVQDPSFVRTCLAYQLYAAAGEPAPRCNFAHVTVNGADLGLYVHVERLDKDFIEEHFADASGALYEGTLSDFRDGWLGSFELDSGSASPRLAALKTALEADDTTLVAEVSAVLDLDHFMTYWAMETLIDHVDGYSGNLNNFYVYDDPTSGKLRFLVNGADFVLISQVETEGWIIPAVMGTGMVARRLYAHPELRQTYLAKVKQLADTLLSTDAVTALLAEVDRMVTVITPYVDLPTVQSELAFLEPSISMRRAAMQRGLDNAPETVFESLRDTPCLAELGAVTATFTTTFETYESADPFEVGSGTFSLTLGEQTVTSVDVGMTAGRPGPGIPVVALQLVAVTADARRFVADIQVSPTRLVDGASLPLILSDTSINLHEQLGGALEPVGQVVRGTLTFSDAAAEDGAAIVGTFEGTVVDAF